MLHCCNVSATSSLAEMRVFNGRRRSFCVSKPNDVNTRAGSSRSLYSDSHLAKWIFMIGWFIYTGYGHQGRFYS